MWVYCWDIGPTVKQDWSKPHASRVYSNMNLALTTLQP